MTPDDPRPSQYQHQTWLIADSGRQLEFNHFDGADTHVYPLTAGQREAGHLFLRSCGCRPHVEERAGGNLVTHRAVDGRCYLEADEFGDPLKPAESVQ